MATDSKAEATSASDCAFAIDRDDPSIGEIGILTGAGWRRFRLPRGELKRLARELQIGLRETVEDQPEG